MKLTNRQAQAIALNIYNEAIKPLKTEYEKTKKVLADKIKLEKEEKKLIKDYVESRNKLDKFEKKFTDRSYSTIGITTQEAQEKRVLTLKKSKFTFDYKESELPNLKEVEDAVMLSLIDAKDLSDIIKAVKEKYKIK